MHVVFGELPSSFHQPTKKSVSGMSHIDCLCSAIQQCLSTAKIIQQKQITILQPDYHFCFAGNKFGDHEPVIDARTQNADADGASGGRFAVGRLGHVTISSKSSFT